MQKYRNKQTYDNGFIFKGTISNPADFPTLAEVQPGWAYILANDVVDNDPSKTNRGQTLLKHDNGVIWDDSGSGEWLFFQIIEAEQEDGQWNCLLVDANIRFTLPNPNRPDLVFSEIYELLTA